MHKSRQRIIEKLLIAFAKIALSAIAAVASAPQPRNLLKTDNTPSPYSRITYETREWKHPDKIISFLADKILI